MVFIKKGINVKNGKNGGGSDETTVLIGPMVENRQRPVASVGEEGRFK